VHESLQADTTPDARSAHVIASPWAPSSGGTGVRIRDVRAICTAPEGTRLVIVKVETSEPGLYGVGCATFSPRAPLVAEAVEKFIRPLVLGREPADIEDIWQSCHLSSYWRGGPVLNSALAGLDEALWDIKGKRAGVPTYELLGGRCRETADVYVHVKGRDPVEIEYRVRERIEQGYRYVRCQPSAPGRLDLEQPRWDPREYCRAVPRMFEHLREQLGDAVELIHDAHERLPPTLAIRLAKSLEPVELFYLEDPFAPEDNDHLRRLRSQSSIPVAMGELYVNEREVVPVITERLIDFIRCHVATIGGLTPARKLAALAGYFGVRTAWHGPDDVSPVGHAAQLQLELATPNFAIHEMHEFSEAARTVFPGTPEVHGGALAPSERPGLGIDVDEASAASYPFPEHALNGSWTPVRGMDGTIARP
jgi:mannonate dehydratase